MADVLIVDDDEAARNTLKRMLEHAGFMVATADNGLAALAELQQQPVEAVVCDIQMPFLHGKSFYAQIEETLPQMASRVVFVTGFADDPETRLFLEQTGQPFLSKPVQAATLVKTVRRFVERPGLTGG